MDTQGSENLEVKPGCRGSQKAVCSFCLRGTSHALAVDLLHTSGNWDLTTAYHTGGTSHTPYHISSACTPPGTGTSPPHIHCHRKHGKGQNLPRSLSVGSQSHRGRRKVQVHLRGLELLIPAEQAVGLGLDRPEFVSQPLCSLGEALPLSVHHFPCV